MNRKNPKIGNFWNSYRRQSESDLPKDEVPEAWGFGDSPKMADELGHLVLTGTKRATCSLLAEYESEGEAIPHVGQLSIILDGNDEPLCLIETIEVQIHPYDQVDAQFAFDEGEGDRSLDYWRREHWRFFSRQCQAIGLQFEEQMPLVCERFRVVFSETGK